MHTDPCLARAAECATSLSPASGIEFLLVNLKSDSRWVVVPFGPIIDRAYDAMTLRVLPKIFFISGLAFIPFRVDIEPMTPIHAKVVSTEKCDNHYRLIVDLVPSEFLGPFERLRFRKNPYCGSFSTSLTKSWLTLTYRKDPGFKTGEVFPLSRTN